MPVVKRSPKVRDSRDAFYDKKTGIYYNHNFWNIENATKDSERNNDTESDFIKRMSPPYDPSSHHTLPRVSSNTSPIRKKNEINMTASETAQHVYRREEDKISEIPAFTLRLGQKDIVQHPLSNKTKSPSPRPRVMKARPKSAVCHEIETDYEPGVSTLKSNNTIEDDSVSLESPPRKLSSPYPMRVTHTTADPSSLASRQIIASYIRSSQPRRTQSAVTPSTFSREGQKKAKAWVSPEAKQKEAVSELSKILQQSKESSKQSERRIQNEMRQAVLCGHRPPHVSSSLCRGSNWRKKDRFGSKSTQQGPSNVYKPIIVRPPGYVLNKRNNNDNNKVG